MKGFTLLEVLVSVAILGIVMAAIYGGYVSSVTTIQSARNQADACQSARILLDQMTKDLECAFIDLPRGTPGMRLGMIGEDLKTETGTGDRIDFTGLTHLSLNGEDSGPDLCEIGYRLVEESEGKSSVLYRREQWPPDDDFTTGGSEHELARGVTEMNITYEGARGESLDNWNTVEGSPSSRLPVLITIDLTIRDRDGREHRFNTGVHPFLSGTAKEE